MRKFFLLFAAGFFALAVFCSDACAAVEVGQAAPALAGPELDRKIFDLSTLKGHVVIVHFWATWCPSCREEMPVLDAFYKQHQAQGVMVVGISADRPRAHDDVVKMMQSFGFAAGMLGDLIQNGFGPPSVLPISYVIDTQGVIRAVLSPDKDVLTDKILSDTVMPLIK